MVVNPKKCGTVVWSDRSGQKPVLTMDIAGEKTPLKVSSGAVYLGMKLNPKGEWSCHRRYRAKKARRWRWRLNSAVRKRGALPIGVAFKMGRSGEAAALNYGAEMWADTKGAAFEQTELAQARQERRILGLPDRTPSVIVRSEAGTEGWARHAIGARLRLLARVCHPECTVDKDITFDVVTARIREIGNEVAETREADWVGRSRAIVSDIWPVQEEAEAAWKSVTTTAMAMSEVEKLIQDGLHAWERRKLDQGLGRTARWETATFGGQMGVLWKDARDELATDDVRWVGRVRAGVLAVAEETGRWEGKARAERICPLCSGRVENAEHLLCTCPEVEHTRATCNARLAEVCGVGAKVGGLLLMLNGQDHIAPPEARSMKKVWLRAINTAIGQIVDARDQAVPGGTRRVEGADETFEEVEEAWVQASLAETERARTAATAPAERARNGQRKRRKMAEQESRTSEQKIDVASLVGFIEDEGLRSAAGGRATRILRAVGKERDTLVQTYERCKVRKGRWYAVSAAQLQSAPKCVRAAAVGDFAMECDLNNAYPTILVNLLPQAPGKWNTLRTYALDRSALRSEVAEGLGIPIKEAKTLLLSVVFGRSVTKWRSSRPDVTKPTPPVLLTFVQELKEARAILAQGQRGSGEAELSALSRRIQGVESEIMDRLERALTGEGYEAGTLVHDALIVQKRDRSRCSGEDHRRVQGTVREVLRELEISEGWTVRLEASVGRVEG